MEINTNLVVSCLAVNALHQVLVTSFAYTMTHSKRENVLCLGYFYNFNIVVFKHTLSDVISDVVSKSAMYVRTRQRKKVTR